MEININIDEELFEHLRPDLFEKYLKQIVDRFGYPTDLPKIILIKIPEYLYPLSCILDISNKIDIYITKEITRNIKLSEILYMEINI